MVYNLLNPIELQQFRAKAEFFYKKGDSLQDRNVFGKSLVVELKERQPQRTTQQNRYLWVTITYVALEEGYTKDYIEGIFKDVNKDIFETVRYNKKGEPYIYMRHLNDLSKDEMTTAIDRWLIHCSSERGLYIPTPEDHYYLQWAHEVEREEEQNKQYL